jgi:predicted CopG family antitoxin
MKNITVSVQEDVYRRARIKAAEANTSVSALVRRFLIDLAQEESESERLIREQNELVTKIRRRHPRFRAADNLPRERIHDRHALR